MINKLILHIPHSSTHFPHKDGFIVGKPTIDKEILNLTDWYTDDLFSSEKDIIVKAEFSRVFCDPERFEDDSQEVMAQFGMGVLYEKSDDGVKIREISHRIRADILKNYYHVHHNKLNQIVEKQLKTEGKAVIIDCHSFPSTPFLRDLDQSTPRPDFNIGTDPYHTPDYLIEISKDFFKKKGFTLGVDWPYKGTIVPVKYYKKTKKADSIMLEVNRALYLKEPSNGRSKNYNEIKNIIKEYLQTIKQNSI